MIKKLPEIEAIVIPHKQHRYETCGDYWNSGGNGSQKYPMRHYRVSEMGNANYEFLVLIHEMIEHHLCEARGISEEEITKFDEAFEAKRKPADESEPGFASDAPYREEHKFATKIEYLIATEMGVDWQKYNRKINSL